MTLTREGRQAQFRNAIEALRAELLFDLVRAEQQPTHKETWLLLAAKHLCQLQALQAVLDEWGSATSRLHAEVAAFAERNREQIANKRAELERARQPRPAAGEGR